MSKHYSSLKEEVEDKRARREKLVKDLKKLDSKKVKLNEKHREIREELEAEQREIQRQNKLYQLIIENFVPLDERERLLKRLQYNDDSQAWSLTELTKHRFTKFSRVRRVFFFIETIFLSAIKWFRVRSRPLENVDRRV